MTDNDRRARDAVSAWSWLPLRVAGLWIRAAAMVVFALVGYGLVGSIDSWQIAYLPANATIVSVTPNCTATETAMPAPGKARAQVSGSCKDVAASIAASPDRAFDTVRHSTSLELGFVTAEGKPVRADSYANSLGLAEPVQPGSKLGIFYQNTAPDRIRLSPPSPFETWSPLVFLIGLLLVSGFIAFRRRR